MQITRAGQLVLSDVKRFNLYRLPWIPQLMAVEVTRVHAARVGGRVAHLLFYVGVLHVSPGRGRVLWGRVQLTHEAFPGGRDGGQVQVSLL